MLNIMRHPIKKLIFRCKFIFLQFSLTSLVSMPMCDLNGSCTASTTALSVHAESRIKVPNKGGVAIKGYGPQIVKHNG